MTRCFFFCCSCLWRFIPTLLVLILLATIWCLIFLQMQNAMKVKVVFCEKVWEKYKTFFECSLLCTWWTRRGGALDNLGAGLESSRKTSNWWRTHEFAKPQELDELQVIWKAATFRALWIEISILSSPPADQFTTHCLSRYTRPHSPLPITLRLIAYDRTPNPTTHCLLLYS